MEQPIFSLPIYLGKHESLAVFSSGDTSVVIDTSLNLLIEHGKESDILSSREWDFSTEPVSDDVYAFAENALNSLNVESNLPLVASARLYTIPTGVQAEAKKALEWRKEHKRGGTNVGMNTARTLAKGGQVGIEKIRHIAKYFPRHEVDKKGKGWKVGQDNFPSNGRIAWALWGGDAAWRWAKAIVEREDKKPVTADGFYGEYGAELNPFIQATEMDESIAPEFLARVRMDGSGIDRVYKIDITGHVYVWDDGIWDDLGHIEGDVWTYDKALDDPYDKCEKSHVQIDPDSAIILCAKMQSNPFKSISIGDIDKEEADMFVQADLVDEFEFIDSVVTAAGAPSDSVSLKSTKKGDGQYTAKERSANASNQVRDAGGMFAKQGGRVVVGGDKSNGRGVITKVNDDKSVTVKLDNGRTINVDAKQTRDEQKALSQPSSLLNKQVSMDEFTKPLDVSGILGEPRTAQGMKAQLPGTMPALTPDDLHTMLEDWGTYVQNSREKFRRFEKPEMYKYGKRIYPDKKIIDDLPNYSLIEDDLTVLANSEEEKKSWEGKFDKNKKPLDPQTPEEKIAEGTEAEEPEDDGVHPLLKEWKARQSTPVKPNNHRDLEWAKPVVAAGEVEEEGAGEPKPSDVQPVYLAVVAPDDPRAVLDLISIVPASTTSPEPMTYVRKDKKWVREPKMLADLKSATPPPVVPLDKEVLNDVLIQVDGIQASAYTLDHNLMVLWGPTQELMNYALNEVFGEDSEALLSAGGVDRNRGGAEKLRRYWTSGEGAMKIKWGTPGDWKRCVRHLSKYLGVRAKGYCQLRHKEATGVYTGSRLNPGNENSTDEFIMEEVWGKNIGTPTVITDEDMLMPIADIMRDKDDIYEHHWEPEREVVTALKELAKCSNEEFATYAMTAGARPPSGYNIDKNRGNAEKLRRYWTVGKGAPKIRWNTGGDWTRCVKHLSKYIGARSKGYCALRHKEMTGMWTGDQAHIKMYGRNVAGQNVFSNEVINSSEKITELAALHAKAEDARNRIAMVAGGAQMFGDSFTIPLVIPEGVESGDGRSFKKGAISFRDLPLPLMWQTQTAQGHDGSVVVGRIDYMERTPEGIGNARGVFDTGVHAKEVMRLLKNGFIRGISADMDRFEAVEEKAKVSEKDGENSEKAIGKDKITINKARVMGITIVPKPAFQECKIVLQSEEPNQQEEPLISDGIYADDADSLDAQSLVACGVVAGAIPIAPPTKWFANPKLDKATPLTVTDDGRVFGHIAAWHVDHIGMAYGTKPPRSKSNYAYFHTGVVRTEDGNDAPVGQLTLAGGHASLHASAEEAVRHYDDTASAIADVHAGEDRHGIWVAGSLRPGTTPEQIRALRASAPSGDWRPIRGSLELVAVCQVNVPGFPIARARVASGAVMALVAAGASTLAKLKNDPLTELSERLARLEMNTNSQLSAKAEAAKAVFAEIRQQNNSALTARMAELSNRFDGNVQYLDDFAFISRRERKDLAEKGEALPDGSFPIRSESDLKNAISSYGRASKADRGRVRKHIQKRARQLKKTNLIPDTWKTATTDEATQQLESMRSRITEFAGLVTTSPVGGEVEPVMPEEERPIEGVEPGKSDAVVPEEVVDVPVNAPTVESGIKVDDKYTPQTQPRDEAGKFRQVLARLKQDLGVSGLQDIVDEAKSVEQLHEIGNYVESAGAAVNLLDILNRLDSGALNKVSLENVRSSASELGKVISNLPLGFNNQAQKVRYSDLPPSLKNLMDDMMDRVEAKIGKDDAEIANADLASFRSGSEVYSQGEISSQMSKLLRLLT
jgi:hypothetical protein